MKMASSSLRVSWLRQTSRANRVRCFHASLPLNVVKPFLLADIGEGTRECQIIQWFVQPGARVEQFDKLCEVQSDKTASDITSPFDGVIKKLYYEADDMALVGKPLLDIDIQSDISPEDEALLETSKGGQADTPKMNSVPDQSLNTKDSQEAASLPTGRQVEKEEVHGPLSKLRQHDKSLATPAVRHLTKELNVKLADVQGTGKDGRVLKEDVQRHASQSRQSTQQPVHQRQGQAEDHKVPLTPVQTAMFKTMTRSLTIPHFLYSSTVDLSKLNRMRERLNSKRGADNKISPLPFLLKAISQALGHHPLLNASLDTSDAKKPLLTYNSGHNFGIAVDTPSGLLVPVIRNVESQSVSSIAEQIKAVSAKAREGKLSAGDMQGATFSVSNIGSIGGGVVAPIIVEPQVAIVGIGRAKVVPGFDEAGGLVKKEETVFSWSADHRVVDGAECARCAERVKGYVERIEEWMVEMR